MTSTLTGGAQPLPGPAGDLLARLALSTRLPAHHAVLQRASAYAATEQRIVGLCLGGSLAWGSADRNSDIDLTVVVEDGDPERAFAEHLLLLAAVGGGRYRAYGDLGPSTVRTLCEVALDSRSGAAIALVSLDVVYSSVANGIADLAGLRWIYLRSDCRHLLSLEEQPETPIVPLSATDLRALDGRFWWWLHLVALRARRGEIWNVLEESALRLRSDVLLKLMASKATQAFAGTRRVEQWLTPGLLDDLDATWAPARVGSVRDSLLGTVSLYRRLRDALAADLGVVFDHSVEDRILAIVHEVPL